MRSSKPPVVPKYPSLFTKRASFREEVLNLHRRIYQKNLQRIRETTIDDPSLKQYEAQYNRYVRGYQRRAPWKYLQRDIKRARLIYLGDYHTLRRSQKTFLDLCQMLAPQTHAILGLEFILKRDQKHVDDYLQHKINESTFLTRIDYDPQNGRGLWENFRPIFIFAQQRGWNIVGLDTTPRGEDKINRRDKNAAKIIVEMLKKHPTSKMLVLFGELHISPNHLPKAVRQQMNQQHLEDISPVLIAHQNCERIYADLVRNSTEHQTTLVTIDAYRYCIINTHPILCQQSFLNTISDEEDGYTTENPRQIFKDCIEEVANFFNIGIDTNAIDVQIETFEDLTFINNLYHSKKFTSKDIKLIKRQILHSQSYFIPTANIVYLGNIAINHISEEATHLLRYVCSKANEPHGLVDAFYFRCLEEALGFIGSKIINPKRRSLPISYFSRKAASPTATFYDKQLAKYLKRHAHLENNNKVSNMADVYNCSADMFNAITHILGYQLGDALFSCLYANKISKNKIRDLFFLTYEDRQSAFTQYLYLTYRCRMHREKP